MHTSTLVQIIAACVGIVGSLFFCIGIMRQSVSVMADLAGTYWDWNPHMVPALAAQKADYLFGGGTIVLAFGTQLLSFAVPANHITISKETASLVPWVAFAATVVLFTILRLASKQVSLLYQKQIMAELKKKSEA